MVKKVQYCETKYGILNLSLVQKLHWSSKREGNILQESL